MIYVVSSSTFFYEDQIYKFNVRQIRAYTIIPFFLEKLKPYNQVYMLYHPPSLGVKCLLDVILRPKQARKKPCNQIAVYRLINLQQVTHTSFPKSVFFQKWCNRACAFQLKSIFLKDKTLQQLFFVFSFVKKTSNLNLQFESFSL